MWIIQFVNRATVCIHCEYNTKEPLKIVKCGEQNNWQNTKDCKGKETGTICAFLNVSGLLLCTLF